MFGSKYVPSKLEEAENHIQRARKALKVSILYLKFTPDYDIAALEYNQAAQCFQAAGSEYALRAIELHIKVAELREKQADDFGSGRAYEQAGTLYEQMKGGRENLLQAIHLWTKAANHYKAAGKVDTAVRLLQKIAKIYDDEINDLQKCEDIYRECLELYELEEKPYYAADIYKTLIDILAKNKRYDVLLKTLDNYIIILLKINQNAGVYKALLSKVVIFLIMGDIIAAENCLLGSGANAVDIGFLSSREFQVGCDAVDAYKSGDIEKFQATLKLQTWSFLQIEIVKLVRQLSIAQHNYEIDTASSSSNKNSAFEDEKCRKGYENHYKQIGNVHQKQNEPSSKENLYDDLLC